MIGVVTNKRKVLDRSKIHVGDMFIFRFTYKEARRVQISDITSVDGALSVEYIYYEPWKQSDGTVKTALRTDKEYEWDFTNGNITVYNISDLDFNKPLNITRETDTALFDSTYFKCGDPVHVKTGYDREPELFGFIHFVETDPFKQGLMIIRYANKNSDTREDRKTLSFNVFPEDYLSGRVEIEKL